MAAGRSTAAVISNAAITVAVNSAAVTRAAMAIPTATASRPGKATTATGRHDRRSPRRSPPKGEPKGIGNVTFMQRSAGPRRDAGRRAN